MKWPLGNIFFIVDGHFTIKKVEKKEKIILAPRIEPAISSTIANRLRFCLRNQGLQIWGKEQFLFLVFITFYPGTVSTLGEKKVLKTIQKPRDR